MRAGLGQSKLEILRGSVGRERDLEPVADGEEGAG
jgi:hypothetical protein